MKIGFDALAADNRSGSGVYCRQLLRALARVDSRNEYHVFLPGHPEELGLEPLSSNFLFHRLLVRSRLMRPLWVQTMLPLHARRLGLHLLHVPQFVAPLWGSTPLVTTIHDVVYEVFPETVRTTHRFFYQKLVPKVIGRCAAIITDSTQSSKEICQTFSLDPQRLTVIGLGADEQFFRQRSHDEIQAVTQRYQLPQQYILAVGTLEPRKNLVTLLRALAVLRTRGMQPFLAIIGRPGWNYKSVLALADSDQLVESVSFLGFVPECDLYCLYQGASAFAFPSLHEGFGLPLLEAMASGLPVVASGIPTSLDLLRKEGTGLMVDAHDIEGWANALEDILNDKELTTHLGGNARAAAQSHTWERAARATLKVYEQAVQRSAADPKT